MQEFLTIVLFLLLGIPLAAALLTYAFFWYETANGPHRLYLERHGPGKIGRLLLRGIISSIYSSLLTILLFPIGFWRKLLEPAEIRACSLPPVILIHGLYHNASAWMFYRRWLAGAGFKNVYSLNYGSWSKSFDDLVQELGHRIEGISANFPERRVVLIGHSLGGLISRAYVETRQGNAMVDAVVTLGSPHQGSKLAVLGLGGLAHSLIHRGRLVEQLEQGGSETDVPRLALHSPLDNMVLPNEALISRQPGWTHGETLPISHVAMLYHKPTAKMAMDYLLNICRQRENQGSDD